MSGAPASVGGLLRRGGQHPALSRLQGQAGRQGGKPATLFRAGWQAVPGRARALANDCRQGRGVGRQVAPTIVLILVLVLVSIVLLLIVLVIVAGGAAGRARGGACRPGELRLRLVALHHSRQQRLQLRVDVLWQLPGSCWPCWGLRGAGACTWEQGRRSSQAWGAGRSQSRDGQTVAFHPLRCHGPQLPTYPATAGVQLAQG